MVGLKLVRRCRRWPQIGEMVEIMWRLHLCDLRISAQSADKRSNDVETAEIAGLAAAEVLSTILCNLNFGDKTRLPATRRFKQVEGG